jgi:hypothetical protein
VDNASRVREATYYWIISPDLRSSHDVVPPFDLDSISVVLKSQEHRRPEDQNGDK